MGKHPLLISILAALSACGEERFDAEGCIEAGEEQMACPSADDVSPKQVFLPGRCGDDLEVVDVKGPGTLRMITGQDGTMTNACCYSVEVVDDDPNSECVVGRPYHDQGSKRRAPLRVSGESANDERSEPERERAAAWAKAGAAEHASAAAFGRLALQLMALGAPLELLRDAERAALDELGHAELCWSLARRSGLRVDGAGPFPFASPIAVNVSLAELAAELVRDGCFEETLGAFFARELAVAAPGAAERAAFATIAEEEANHAVLAFRVVAWALRTGGPEVRDAVHAAFTATKVRLALGELSRRTGVEPSLLQSAAERCLSQVLEPARDRLLS